MTYTLKKSMTSGDNGEAPDPIKRTRPPSFSFILLNTNLSHIGDGFRPEMIILHESTKDQKEIAGHISELMLYSLGGCIRLEFTIYFFNLVRSTMFLYLIILDGTKFLLRRERGRYFSTHTAHYGLLLGVVGSSK
jgi:hypothetical protein